MSAGLLPLSSREAPCRQRTSCERPGGGVLPAVRAAQLAVAAEKQPETTWKRTWRTGSWQHFS